MKTDDQTELHDLHSERDRLRAEKAEIGEKLVILDGLVNLPGLRRRVLWMALAVLLLSPLILGALMGLFIMVRYGPGM